MENSVSIEVYETKKDYIEFLKKQKLYITLPLVFILVVILSSNGKIFAIPGFSTKTNIMIIIGILLLAIGMTICFHAFLIQNFKKIIETKPNYYNYEIKLYDTYLVIDRGEAFGVDYKEVKIKKNKKCYFIYYADPKRGKGVCIINKEYLNEEAIKILEKHLKKK